MTREEYFLHHFFTKKEAQLIQETLFTELHIVSQVQLKTFAGLNSGKPSWYVSFLNNPPHPFLSFTHNVGRLITLETILEKRYKDELALFIVHIVLDDLYEQMTQPPDISTR